MIRTKKVIYDYITHEGIDYNRQYKIEDGLVTIQWLEINGYETILVEYYHSDKGWSINNNFCDDYTNPKLEVIYQKMISEIPPLI